MLLTNETIAEEYYWLELPFVYRIHETPDEEKLRTFATFLNNFGYSLHLTNHTIHPKELQKLLSRIEGSEAEGLISRILLAFNETGKIFTGKSWVILACRRSITAILLHRFAVTLICRYTALSRAAARNTFKITSGAL